MKNVLISFVCLLTFNLSFGQGVFTPWNNGNMQYRDIGSGKDLLIESNRAELILNSTIQDEESFISFKENGKSWGLHGNWGGQNGFHINYYDGNNFTGIINMKQNGKVGIGVAINQFTKGDYKLYVDKGIRTEHIKIDIKNNWSDYVFEDGYNLKSLNEVKKYIEQNGHLEDIPSAQEVKENGIDIGTMNVKLLKKIEELTLYNIKQQEKIEKLQKENKKLKAIRKEINELKVKMNNIK